VSGVTLSRGKPAAIAGEGVKSALTVTTVKPEVRVWSERVTASGSVTAWQEAIIGAEIGGLRLADVLVNVGDKVKKGEVLARFADEMVLNGIHQQEAAVDEAKAKFSDADLKAQRAIKLNGSGVMSLQDRQQIETAAKSAEAQLKTAEAKLEAEKIKMGYTRVRAIDDGVISSRTATVGSVSQTGSELFRLIRRNKLEWRADLPEQQLQRVKVGQTVIFQTGTEPSVHGVVVRIAPMLDAQSRNGTAYVELPADKFMRAGMFVQGEFVLGKSDALTLPQSSVIMRDGYAYVFRLGKDNHVEQVKVMTGRRRVERVEITGGIDADALIIGLGAGFLMDGDVVRVENAKAGNAQTEKAKDGPSAKSTSAVAPRKE
jgi:RND family efflux transporter MFP subunit